MTASFLHHCRMNSIKKFELKLGFYEVKIERENNDQNNVSIESQMQKDRVESSSVRSLLSLLHPTIP